MSTTYIKYPATNNATGQQVMAQSTPVVIASDQTAIPVTATFADPAEGTPGAAVPSKAIYVAGNKAGNLSGLLIGSQTSANSLGVVIASDQGALTVAQATAANLNATVVGTGTFAVQAAQSGTWANKVTDGTNNAAVKAASTTPVATDPALVVTISPNTATVPISGTITATNSANANTGGAVPTQALSLIHI